MIDHVTIACPSRVELRSNNRSILVFVSLERVILSIFRYLKQPANELPQPADVPTSTIVAVNRTVASTLSKRRRSSYNRYSCRNNLDIGRYAVVYGTSSVVRKYSKALCIDIR